MYLLTRAAAGFQYASIPGYEYSFSACRPEYVLLSMLLSMKALVAFSPAGDLIRMRVPVAMYINAWTRIPLFLTLSTLNQPGANNQHTDMLGRETPRCSHTGECQRMIHVRLHRLQVKIGIEQQNLYRVIANRAARQEKLFERELWRNFSAQLLCRHESMAA